MATGTAGDKGTPTVYLERSSRATRGKRLTKLIDEAAEADEQFWGQDAFKEDAGDAEYEAEEEVVDEFDSDFYEDETNVEEEAEEEVDERRERIKKKKLVPPGTKKTKEKKKSSTKVKGLDVIEAAVAAATEPDLEDSKAISVSIDMKQIDEENDLNDNSVGLEAERIIRKSTRTAVVIRQAERDALRAAMQTAIKPVKKKREGERRITQEDMLLEAAQTEIRNRQNLERMLAREEEVKQKAIVHKIEYSGPQIRFYSKDGKNYLEFIGADAMAKGLFSHAKPRKSGQGSKRALVCAVTGLPAKYIDPLTGIPYATKEAFQLIRHRLAKLEEESQMERSKNPWKRARSKKPSGSFTSTNSRSFGLKPGTPSKLSDRFVSSSLKHDLMEKIKEFRTPERPSYPALSNSVSPALSSIRSYLPTSSSPFKETAKLFSIGQSPSQQQQRQELHLASLEPREDIHNAATKSDAPAIPLGQNSNVPIWVDIPPPQGSCEDDYGLDDLTSLDFGPILMVQHGVSDQDRRDHELDIMETPSAETVFQSDMLTMPNFIDKALDPMT